MRDLAAIRKLLEEEEEEVCPSCEMPFDKGKKRKLIDSCGHERCYSCMFKNEQCPLCPPVEPNGPAKKLQANPQEQRILSQRPQVKTNGHFTSYMQVSCSIAFPSALAWGDNGLLPLEYLSGRLHTPGAAAVADLYEVATARNEPLREWSPSRLPKPGKDSCNHPGNVMTQSCPTPPQGRKKFFLSPKTLRNHWGLRSSSRVPSDNALSDDEGGTIRPVCQPRKNQQDLYMRLGLLLGENARHGPKASNRSSRSHDSISSLASLEANTLASTNTSPVSTLTGSSEADQHRNLKEPSSDSVGSLMSMSGQSNCSSSPLQRRHSLTTSHPGRLQELNAFKNRKQSIRRSARSGSVKGPIDPRVRFAEYRNQQLPLKPLFFEVPVQESDPMFVGRDSIVREIENCLATSLPGVLISGHPGTGKTALMLQLVEYSCFGRRKQDIHIYNGKDRPSPSSSVSQSIYCQVNLVSERIQHLASHVVAYHFCQAYLSLKECIVDPAGAWRRGVMEPLCALRRVGKISGRAVILVDGLCEAEYHRPDHGDTIAAFIARHAHAAPQWLKFVLTVRTHMDEVMPTMPFQRLSLDVTSSQSETLQKDLLDYMNYRVSHSPSIQSNIISGAAGQFRLCQHLAGLAKGSMLFAKLSLDLIERGHLVAKSTSYKVLPVSPIISVCLAALYPLTLLEIYYSVNALNTTDFLSWEDFLERFKMLSGVLVKRMDNTYMFFHPSFREWLIRRDEGESNKFLIDLRVGHAGIVFRLSRLQAPLDAEKTLELGHHILKAHIYKNMTLQRNPSRDLQAHWVATVSADVSVAVSCLRNIYSPNILVSRLLLLAGANPDHKTDLLGNASALCLFAHEGVVDMVSLLLEFGADVNSTNSQGCTPLSLAAIKGHMQVVVQLVSAGAILGRTDTAGRCALVHAARNGHLNIVSYLISSDWMLENVKLEVDLCEALQQSLVAAAAQGHVEIVEYLLDLPEVKPDSLDSLSGETALCAAAANGCTAVCSALVGRGANRSAVNRKKMAPLMLTVKEGHWGTAERLLQLQAPLEQTDLQGKTALMIAATEGHVALIDLLLDKGADIGRTDEEGTSSLGWACQKGKLQAVQCLLDRGAEVNQVDKSGKVPLDHAATQGNPAIVQLLLERGAMLEHVDMNGVRPLDRAIIIVLLNKLLEDGNVLYRKNRLQEAAHRYSYALNKFPPLETLDSTFRQLRLNFLLNHSRCKRKMNKPIEAIELATQVLKQKPDCYEAYYARAKARIDLRNYEEAEKDIQEALLLLPPQNKDIRKILLSLRDEIKVGHRTASVDTLDQSTTSL
ncbi:unnamed protein product [Nezara viridula]|uniref:RING-type domain-containing protein n=1 Tax=Nezara viridula TaxID=85310 RepID=A0A9P0DZ82_NEZVI|nr:unnamed protein product [Nezara viridula]